MRTHRFVGATSREVLNKVKQALGDDALIVSNRAHDGGIEVVAMAAVEMMDEPVSAKPAAPKAAAPTPTQRTLYISEPESLDEVFAEAPAVPAPVARHVFPRVAAPAPIAPAAPAPVAAAPVAAAPALAATSAIPAAAVVSSIPAFAAAAVTRSTSSPAFVAPAVATRPAAAPLAAVWPPMSAQPAAPAPVEAAPAAVAPVAADRTIDGILNEIQNLKSVLQRDIASLGSPEASESASAKSGVMHELLNAGFSVKLSRQIADEVCSANSDPTIEDVAACIEREVWVAGADDIINRGGVYALVGPTGVGKTTTLAKLAARAVVRFGASKVALLTTDSYRVGAHDQLRIYGRILSVPVHAIRDAQELASVLEQLKDRHLVLIDTIGMSQRDKMVAEQAAMLAGAGDVMRLLLVQTTANARTLEQVVTAYKRAGVDGCILTKIDEAASIAPALDVIVRHQLPLHYVTDGQRVPEDLQLPDSGALVREALKPSEDDAFDFAPEEMAFMMPTVAPQKEVAFG